MSLVSKVKLGLQNPRLIPWEFASLYHRKLRGQTGASIMDEDWDNLCILDACRYDQFEELNPMEGELRSVVSKGSATPQFFRENFVGKEFPDVVYVSANPQFERFELGSNFHASAKLWEDHWDEDLNTVPAEAVAEVGKEMAAEYPNKRLVLHFLQPHYPFIGETGREMEHRAPTGKSGAEMDTAVSSVWEQLKRGEVTADRVWKAYNENLELAFPEVEDLVDDLFGKTVVTSDHGNAFGKYGVYGHPSKRFLKELVKVPWFVAEFEERKEIKSGDLADRQETSAEVNERLKNLGYA